jgi:membrane-associated phospholipid phosphatase
MAIQDYAVVCLYLFLTFEALTHARGEHAYSARVLTLGLLSCAVLTLLLVRGAIIEPQPLRALIYRAGMLGTIFGSYFALRPLLPALAPVYLDPQLLSIDQALFGKTPAAWLDAFVSPSTVEWFAFFYYSYYWLLLVYLVGTLLLDDGRRRYELLLAAALVVCIGHCIYIFVPGVGPYAWPQLAFRHQLVGGPWWGRVWAAVATAGALLDIFPSLHTALALTTALHALRFRREPPFRWAWLPTVFVAGNIVVATVFLRWHYGIDLIAGALLAIFAQQVAKRTWLVESTRAHSQRQEVWEPFLPEEMVRDDRRWIIGIMLIQVTAVIAGFIASRL